MDKAIINIFILIGIFFTSMSAFGANNENINYIANTPLEARLHAETRWAIYRFQRFLQNSRKNLHQKNFSDEEDQKALKDEIKYMSKGIEALKISKQKFLEYRQTMCYVALPNVFSDTPPKYGIEQQKECATLLTKHYLADLEKAFALKDIKNNYKYLKNEKTMNMLYNKFYWYLK